MFTRVVGVLTLGSWTCDSKALRDEEYGLLLERCLVLQLSDSFHVGAFEMARK